MLGVTNLNELIEPVFPALLFCYYFAHSKSQCAQLENGCGGCLVLESGVVCELVYQLLYESLSTPLLLLEKTAHASMQVSP